MIQLFWLLVLIFCIVSGIAVLLYSFYLEYRSGGTELFCLFFVSFGVAIFAYVGYQYGGDDVARTAGGIGWIISYFVFVFLVSLKNFLFCPFPVRKKCKVRACHPHYDNWIPIQSDIWYRKCYVCHQEYVLFCFKYEALVNPDGTLKPYLKRTKLGWRKDDGFDSKELLLSLSQENIARMRNECQTDET